MSMKMIDALRALAQLTETVNARQHAGLVITPFMWSELYQLTNDAKAVIAEYERANPSTDV